MYLTVNGERNGFYIGQAKLKSKRKNKAEDKFCSGMNALIPRHVKECLLLATRLRLRHPEGGPKSTNEDMRDTVMERIHKEGEGNQISKNDMVTTVNNHVLKTLIEILSVSFLMDNYGPVSTAPKEWDTTPSNVKAMLRHSQEVIVDFLVTHDDRKYGNDYVPQGMCLLSFFWSCHDFIVYLT